MAEEDILGDIEDDVFDEVEFMALTRDIMVEVGMEGQL